VLSVGRLLFALFSCRLFRSNTDAFDFDARQFATVADRAVITFAPSVFERDDLLVLALFENFRGHSCSRDQRVSLRYVLPIRKHQYIAKRGSFACFDIEKIDIERVPFRDAKLSATSSDDCVSHSFSGEKSRQKFHRRARLATGKLEADSVRFVTQKRFRFERRRRGMFVEHAILSTTSPSRGDMSVCMTLLTELEISPHQSL
jgi:hypothetical protein